MTSLRAELAAICAAAEPGLGASRPAVGAVKARLAEPALRLVVAGRLNAGKSTLVNVLLGEHLAATDATECTRVVAWYRYHPYNRVEVTMRDGSTRLIPAANDGGLPASLGCRLEDVSSVALEACNPRLRNSLAVIDTPGLDSLSFLDADSVAAIRQADALLYVMPLPGENDRKVLATVRDALSGSRMSAANVIGVLSRIDQLGSGTGDPWETAHRAARRYAAELRGLAGEVIPVAGRLAAAATADRYTDADSGTLRALAETDRGVLRRALYSPERFLDWADAPVDRSGRTRVLGLLGMYGVREAVAAIQAGHRSTQALLAQLRQRSGVDALFGAITDNITRQADRLRAAIALSTLETIAAGNEPGLAALSAELRRFRDKPAMRQAALADALIELNAGRYHLSPDDEAALIALATGGDPASQLRLPADATAGDIAARAVAENTRWNSLANSHSHMRALAYHAQSAAELCAALYRAARPTAGT